MFCKKKIMAFLWKVNRKRDQTWPFHRYLCCCVFFCCVPYNDVSLESNSFHDLARWNVAQERQIASGVQNKNDSVSKATRIVISLTVWNEPSIRWAGKYGAIYLLSAARLHKNHFNSEPAALTRPNNPSDWMHLAKQVGNQDHLSTVIRIEKSPVIHQFLPFIRAELEGWGQTAWICNCPY